MRIRQLMLAFAAIALAACSGSADEELAGEALSADEVAGAAGAEFTMPRPGQYRAEPELISFEMPSLSSEAKGQREREFAALAVGGYSYCVAAGTTAQQWLSEINQGECSVSSSNGREGAFEAELVCTDSGVSVPVAISGTISADESVVETTLQLQDPEAGAGTVRMRIKSERTGDCA